MNALLQVPAEGITHPQFGAIGELTRAEWADKNRVALVKWYHDLFHCSADDVEWEVFTHTVFQRQSFMELVCARFGETATDAANSGVAK